MGKYCLPKVKINLKSKRVILKTFILKNIDDLYIKWFDGKNEVLKYSRHYKKKYPRSLLIKNFINFKSYTFFIGIFDKKSNNLIGTMIATEMKGLKLNIGILIGHSDYFSKGYAYESIELFIKYVFKKKKYKSVIFGTDKKNISMINLAKKFKVTKKLSNYNSKVIYELRNIN